MTLHHPSRGLDLSASLLAPELEAHGTELVLRDDSFHHLVRVRRIEVGERIQLTDGKGATAIAVLAEVSRREARLEVGPITRRSRPLPAVELVVAPPKPERASWLVEKATELGAVRIHFALTHFSSRKGHPLDRWRRIAVSALEQSFGAWLPDSLEPAPLAEVLGRLEPQRRFLLDPEGNAPVRATSLDSAVLAVGPEGGFDAAERHQLEAAGFEPLGLGPRVLRVETAAIVAIGVVGMGLVPT